MAYLFRWKSAPDLARLEQTNDRLRTELIKLRRQLTTKAGYATRLELVLHQRMERIDRLNEQLERARAQNRQLDAECEHLAGLVRTS